jgi:hypothetical protein
MQNKEDIRKLVESYLESYFSGRLGKARSIDDNSKDGLYLASGNLDRTPMIWEFTAHNGVKSKD